MHGPTSDPPGAPACPSCGGALDAAVRCVSCARRYALVPTSDPQSEQTELLVALASARDDGERRRIRHRLSRVLADMARHDLLLALWSDAADDPETQLWRGVAAVIAQPATSLPAVEPLERAAAAFLAEGRRDLLALARAYLVHALLSEQRVGEAEAVGDAAIAAAIEERDSEACIRAAFTRFYAIAYDLRLDYRVAERRMREIADVIAAWDPPRARRLAQARARMMLLSDPAEARRVIDEVGTGADDMSRVNDIRFRAQLAIVEEDVALAERALDELLHTAIAPNSEIPRWVSLRRAEAALVGGRPSDAVALAREAMPPTWHRSCSLRIESRWALAEAHARLLPPDAAERRLRAARRFIRRAERFAHAGIPWREMRARLVAGELLRSVRLRREAVRELTRARELAERLSIPAAAATIAAHLRALGVSTTEVRTPVERLTRRESEIARLISEGATNADIAKRLLLSESTVARHVSNILLKLDLGNRRDIGALVRGVSKPT